MLLLGFSLHINVFVELIYKFEPIFCTTTTIFFYFCEFGRLGSGGGAFERAGIAGNSLGFLGILLEPLFGACRFGNGGGAPNGAGCCGIRLVCGMAGADRVAIVRVGLDVFDEVGATSKS